eukprot:9498988-Pyramimonas_sp.AAC.1
MLIQLWIVRHVARLPQSLVFFSLASPSLDRRTIHTAYSVMENLSPIILDLSPAAGVEWQPAELRDVSDHVPVYAILAVLSPNSCAVIPKWVCRQPGFTWKVEKLIEDMGVSEDPAVAVSEVKSIMHLASSDIKNESCSASSKTI